MRETPRRLSELMGDDHHDLDDRLGLLKGLPASDRTTRQVAFDAFRSDLLHHMAIEEEHLFPRMLELDPSLSGLVRRLLDEHRAIKDALDLLGRELALGSGAVEASIFELTNVLGEHNAREEESVYPWLDDHLTSAELVETARRLGLKDR